MSLKSDPELMRRYALKREPEPTLSLEAILALPADAQEKCPLFDKLPPEIRSDIFAYALTDYPEQSPVRQYGEWMIYSRPSYFAPRRTDVDLLYTCRAIYKECWFMPFTLREQTHWLTEIDRSPRHYQLWPEMIRLRKHIIRMAEYRKEPTIEIDHLHFFAQMWKLEANDMEKALGTLPDILHPRIITLTIRHADWWHWEQDAPLRLEGEWLRPIFEHLHPSLQEFRIELESLERKKDQIKGIADQMMDKWYFQSQDGKLYFADHTEEWRWTGASRFKGTTWKRDESREGQIDYYIKTVSFKPEGVVERNGGTISENARRHSTMEQLCKCRWKLHFPELDKAHNQNNPQNAG